MKLKLFVPIVFSFFLLVSSAHPFEIPYPNEKGFFIGAELPYQTTSKQGRQEGIFVFGQSKIFFSEKEYYDCVFQTATSISHFYFSIDSVNQALLFKGLEIKNSKIDTNQPVTSIAYPLTSDKKWVEKGIEITGKNIEIPGLGIMPTLTVKNVQATTLVSSGILNVPAGIFEALRIETIFSGDVFNIPVSIVQRTWLDKKNIILKLSFEFNFLSKITPIFDMELIALTSANIHPIKKISSQWGLIKK